MNKSNQILSTLTASEIAEVKYSLECFDSCIVTRNRNTGKIIATNAIVLHNGQYDEYLGEVLADEVFTSEERILNYVKNFRDYPWPQYKGAKDWKKLDSDWTEVSLNAEGNLIFA
jgi:hypothetical protein